MLIVVIDGAVVHWTSEYLIFSFLFTDDEAQRNVKVQKKLMFQMLSISIFTP